MEIKLNVSIGATLQVKNAKGDWDWIKPEVGAEIKLIDGEIDPEKLPNQFAILWDEVVGPQFESVVQELISDQVPVLESTEDDSEEEKADEKPNTDEDDYY
jgi:spermidine/putrescine-binding protein